MKRSSVKRRCIVGVMSALMLIGSAGVASAQGGVITLEETSLKGRIQKPEAFYILQHAQLDYESLDTRPSFIEELKETVEEDPF